jgi:hypothetical protein
MKRAAEKGAEFLLMHRLLKADHHGYKVINQNWLKLSFPWFYGYNILRGLTVLIKLDYVDDERLVDALKFLFKNVAQMAHGCLKMLQQGECMPTSKPWGNRANG